MIADEPQEYGGLLVEHLDRLSLITREAWQLYEKTPVEKTGEKIQLLKIIAEMAAARSQILELMQRT